MLVFTTKVLLIKYFSHLVNLHKFIWFKSETNWLLSLDQRNHHFWFINLKNLQIITKNNKKTSTLFKNYINSHQ